jgi:hypothetical protein
VNVEPCDDLLVSVLFSQKPANVPTTGTASWLTSNRVILMTEVGSTTAALGLAAAVLDTDVGGATLNLRFAKDLMQLGKTYRLLIDASQFLTAGGQPFSQDGLVGDPTYRMTDCLCSGHGSCQYPGPSGTCVYCVCTMPWAGTRCEACAEGFHATGNTCIANEQCAADSCSGHGACDDKSGSVRCTCDLGYASAGTGHCNACAYGFSGYPKCVEDSPDINKGVCNAQLLPRSLDTVSYLGWKGYMDLSGEFYIDTRTMMHETQFSLSQESVFRIYAGPHKIDVDLWLFSLHEDGTID